MSIGQNHVYLVVIAQVLYLIKDSTDLGFDTSTPDVTRFCKSACVAILNH